MLQVFDVASSGEWGVLWAWHAQHELTGSQSTPSHAQSPSCQHVSHADAAEPWGWYDLIDPELASSAKNYHTLLATYRVCVLDVQFGL